MGGAAARPGRGGVCGRWRGTPLPARLPPKKKPGRAAAGSGAASPGPGEGPGRVVGRCGRGGGREGARDVVMAGARLSGGSRPGCSAPPF